MHDQQDVHVALVVAHVEHRPVVDDLLFAGFVQVDPAEPLDRTDPAPADAARLVVGAGLVLLAAEVPVDALGYIDDGDESGRQ